MIPASVSDPDVSCTSHEISARRMSVKAAKSWGWCARNPRSRRGTALTHARLPAPFCFVVMIVVCSTTAVPEEIPSAAIRDKAFAILRAGLEATGEVDFWPAMHAAEGLTAAGQSGEVRAVLGPRMVAEADARRRCGLARELVRAGDVAKLAVLVEVLSSPDPSGHVHAAESLFKVGEIGDAAVTTRAFAQQENFKLHLMAAAALARRGGREPLTAIRTVLRGRDPDGIMLAGWTLGQIGDDADIEPLRSRLADAPTPLIRAFLEHALALRGDAAGLEALTRNLASADEAIRVAAANAAGEARAQATAAALVLLLDDPGLDVRIRAAHSLLVLDRPKVPSPSGREPRGSP